MKKPETKKAAQSAAFIEAAKALGCDEDPAHFDEALKKVARHKPKRETKEKSDDENEESR
jgi:hypothetical protein